jgi:phasin family protein
MTNLFLDTWKRQLDGGLGMLEIITAGAIRMRQCQLEAATQAHADLDATRKAIAAAHDVTQLFQLQADWARANAEKSLAYWRALCQCVAETDVEVAKCSRAGTALPLPESPDALLGAMDSAYRQWLATVQRMYSPAAKVAA